MQQKKHSKFEKVSNQIKNVLGIIFSILLGIILFFGILGFVAGDIQQKNLDAIFNLITIDLTLFGFCLVGGIFEQRHMSEKDIKFKLFDSALSFLTSTIFFLIFIASIYFPYQEGILQTFMKFIASINALFVFLAVLAFVYGLVRIFLDLNKHWGDLQNLD